MVLFAFSLQDQVEKYGAYVGIAAFFGLAILSLLYFAQAREVKRLREWAGRAPERAMELEQAVVEHAQEVQRAPATPVPAPQPRAVIPEPAQAVATNGVVKLKPEEVAALAFARAAGVHEPHEPTPHPVPAAALATAEPATRAVTVDEPAPVLNGGGNGAPPPATPAARRNEPTLEPLPPRRKAPPARRPVVAAPPPRESNTRAVIITAVVGVVVLVAAAAAAFGLFGGGDDPQQAGTGTPTPAATTEDGGGGKGATPKPTATPVKKSDAKVFLFNGTSQGGLAATYQNALIGDAYPKANTDVSTLAEADQAQTSVVMYNGAKAQRAARGVASSLGIKQVVEIDDALKTALASDDKAKGKDWNVVVVIGQDKRTS